MGLYVGLLAMGLIPNTLLILMMNPFGDLSSPRFTHSRAMRPAKNSCVRQVRLTKGFIIEGAAHLTAAWGACKLSCNRLSQESMSPAV